MATRKVYAVPGRLFSLPGRKGTFVGYERLAPGVAGGDVSVPGGASYSLRADGEDVPDTIDVRRAIGCGDITEEAPALPTAPTIPAPVSAPSDAGDAGDEVQS